MAARDLLFFDTETTGLAGGTGTRAFMIGAADWHVCPQRGEGLRIRQLLMATMAAEDAMLATFAGWLQPSTVFCSYNGRSYDAPLLKARYRLARQPDPISALDHVDLLYPTRRRYRGRWRTASCPPSNASCCASCARTTCRARRRQVPGCASCAAATR